MEWCEVCWIKCYSLLTSNKPLQGPSLCYLVFKGSRLNLSPFLWLSFSEFDSHLNSMWITFQMIKTQARRRSLKLPLVQRPLLSIQWAWKVCKYPLQKVNLTISDVCIWIWARILLAPYSLNSLGSIFLLLIKWSEQWGESNGLKEIGNVIFIDYGNHFLKTNTFIICDVPMGVE